MRFTGQVKIPDLDYPGVPAEVLVEGKHTELFVQGESLGRWSLVDVRAERLVASAFSIKLGDEEITFIADQPTEFAYAGVDEMANVWARHRAKRFPVRVIANSRSRRGTKPSRIDDLRSAIEEALSGSNLNALPGGEVSTVKPVAHRPAVSHPQRPVAKPADFPESREDRTADVPAPEAAETGAPAPTPSPEAEQVASPREPITHDEIPVAPDTPDAIFAEPEPEPEPPPPAADTIYKDTVPWATTGRSDPGPEEPGEPASSAPRAEPPTPEEAPAAPRDETAGRPKEPPSGEGEAERRPAQPAAGPEPDATGATQSDQETPGDAPSVPWMAPPQETRPQAVPASAPDAAPRRAEPEEAAPGQEGDAPEPAPQRREYVVDLGAFEDEKAEEPVRPSARAPEPDPEPEAAERGGIMGAVRSAFVRTKTEHQHDYVEAPGGLGIKRQICAECGHISIGVSE